MNRRHWQRWAVIAAVTGSVGVGLGGRTGGLPGESIVYAPPLRVITTPSVWAEAAPLTPDQYNFDGLQAKRVGKITTYYSEGHPQYIKYLNKVFALSESCFNNRFLQKVSLYYFECDSLADLMVVGTLYDLDKNKFKSGVRLIGAEAEKLYLIPIRSDDIGIKKSKIPINFVFPTPIIDILDLRKDTTVRYIFDNLGRKFFDMVKTCTILRFLDERRGFTFDKMVKDKIYLKAVKSDTRSAVKSACHLGFSFDLKKKVGGYYSW